MRDIAKQCELRGNYKLKKAELIDALRSDIIDAPVPLATQVLTPVPICIVIDFKEFLCLPNQWQARHMTRPNQR